MENSRVPVVESFELIGLHGYKDVLISFDDATRIIIAENGSGKTTILNALDAFLRSDYSRLYSIGFETVKCKFSDFDEPITLNRADLDSIANSHSGDAMKQIRQFSDLPVNDIYEFISTAYRPDDSDEWRRARVAHDFYLSSPFDWSEVSRYFDELKTEIENAYSEELKYVNTQLRSALSEVDLLYLPTYRRVEKAMQSEDVRTRRRRIAGLSRLHKRSEFADPGIKYGLDDVQYRLTELSQEIQQRTNAGYRKISKEIIDDLLAGGLTGYQDSLSALPDLAVLKRFFSRVGEISDGQVARIENVYGRNSEERQNSEASQLVYFLSKLATVVHETYQLESKIEEFTAIANSYLESTSDAKKLVYDPVDMMVSVVDSWTGSSLELNDLSSGEKQVVSLVAHLYLSSRDKIVLIDEPELSLSIEWQKRILPDIFRSPRCRQLLAITHSPFIFDNEMDSLASSLHITRRRASDAE